MKNVYVLISTYDEHEYDSCPLVQVVGVFTSEALAQQKLYGYDHHEVTYHIEEWELQGE